MNRRSFFTSLAAMGAAIVVPSLGRAVTAMEAEALLPECAKYADILLTDETFPRVMWASVYTKLGGRWIRVEQEIKPNEPVLVRLLIPDRLPAGPHENPDGSQYMTLRSGAVVWGGMIEEGAGYPYYEPLRLLQNDDYETPRRVRNLLGDWK